MESKKAEPELKVWILEPKDPMEPPFHFTGVPQRLVIAADSAAAARRLAASEAGGEVWQDDKMATCRELQPKRAEVIARITG